MDTLNRTFKGRMCEHFPGEHDWVMGSETKATENYTWEMTDMVHRAFKLHVDNLRKHIACCSLVSPMAFHYNNYQHDDDLSTTADGLSDTELEEFEETAVPLLQPDGSGQADTVGDVSGSGPADTGHRRKLAPQPIYSALVHTLLSPHQIKQDSGAQAALRAEADKHEKGKTWLLDTVREASEVLAESRKTGV